MTSKWFTLFGPVTKMHPSQHTNIAVEFNILYRWHQFIPPSVKLFQFEGTDYDKIRIPYPNEVDALTVKGGLETYLLSASRSSVGKLVLNNTDPFLAVMAVMGGLRKTRYYRLKSVCFFTPQLRCNTPLRFVEKLSEVYFLCKKNFQRCNLRCKKFELF